ncbi:nidogen-like domain-containing protein [Thalassomonas sp. RHCl1]|uniref:nidogen-like domain-containing protein n=1 Tax=Thalassomonas sp. RHCl1 TaxID=2995320 RepID=UPI00248CD043|nr:nidogen-like domain-containing protein [Thalassomonas sp. RHCl1]
MLFKSLLCSALVFASSSVLATPIVSGLGGSAGFGENVLPANDDGSSGLIDITPALSGGLDFFGTNYTGLYVNNNGNVTFAERLGTFTPYALTGATDNPIIAPFFADVDTRAGATTASPGGNSTGSNQVYWDLDDVNNIFTVTWDDVGYFSQHNELVNSFQLALIDKGNGDFNIEFRYETINWTTGDSSGGSNGVGGTVARAGWNSGNGTDFSEINHSGDQAGMLNMPSNSNVGVAGLYVYEVRNGVVSEVPEPSTLAIFGLALCGLLGRRKFQG